MHTLKALITPIPRHVHARTHYISASSTETDKQAVMTKTHTPSFIQFNNVIQTDPASFTAFKAHSHNYTHTHIKSTVQQGQEMQKTDLGHLLTSARQGSPFPLDTDVSFPHKNGFTPNYRRSNLLTA